MANSRHSVPWLALPLSFLAALVLATLPLPQALSYWRPEFVTMALIFWALNAPHLVGIWVGFFIGLLLDVLLATPFGVHPLALALVAFLARLSWRWVAVLLVWQTSGLVLSLVFVSLLVKRLLLGIVSSQADSVFYWMPALSSALLWPMVMVVLRRHAQR